MTDTPESPDKKGDHGSHWLLWAIIVGVVLGGVIGALAPEFARSIKFLGELFLNALKMMIVPLVVASMISGIASLGDVRKLGKPGFLSIALFTITTALAVLIGIIFVNLFQPGVGFSMGEASVPESAAEKADKTLLGVVEEVLVKMVSPNIIQAAAETDILPLIFFALLFGGVLTVIGPKGEPVIAFFQGINEAMMVMVNLIMYAAPIGIMALIAGRLGDAGGGPAFWAELSRLGKYAACVITALLAHAVIVLPLFVAFIARRNPLAFFSGLAKALTTAFSTASSSATLPLTLESIEENNGVSAEAASFVLPLGATINMNGTALYESVAAIFIAQAAGIHLGLEQQMLVFITASLAAIGAAGIPEAGLVTMVLVLKAVGLPLEGVGLILSIDWFLDRCRTAVNVWGDCVVAACVDRVVFSKLGH